jgi:hypothetical protein
VVGWDSYESDSNCGLTEISGRAHEALAIYRNRFPTKHDTVLLLAACVFPVHVWAILNTLWELPAWVRRSSLWDVVGSIAYSQAAALLESLILLLILVVICAILPARYLRERVVAHGGMAVFLTAIWAVGIHYRFDRHIGNQLPASWPSIGGIVWFTLYLVAMGLTYVLIYRQSKFKKLVESLVQGLAVVSFLYISLDLLCIGLLVLRNV